MAIIPAGPAWSLIITRSCGAGFRTGDWSWWPLLPIVSRFVRALVIAFPFPLKSLSLVFPSFPDCLVRSGSL